LSSRAFRRGASIAELENVKDDQAPAAGHIDALISERFKSKVESRGVSEGFEDCLDKLRSDVDKGWKSSSTIRRTRTRRSSFRTAENKVYVRREGKTIFEAVCSTGKGTTMVIDGRTMIFNTPTGAFRIQSKEENPVWVPPDWHFVEEARKKKLEVVRLRPGEGIDAETGAPVSLEQSRGVWGLLRSSDRPRGRVLKMKGDSVVEVGPDGAERPLPPGELIRAGKALVLPPPGSAQRRFNKVLGHYRLNIGNGYALHGRWLRISSDGARLAGCVRLADPDIERLSRWRRWATRS
jgi:lipoprotein-anchoring transpeptidase ErfK/SrfK